ncbi:uncharacterized protein LOC126252793 [Schistocerca nitens]|uniref:uncharacterized protein LOC126252793 n=1 Tax=Schistocerca nitens TaxID=7011 RepID=UPI002119504D|nr:uncharacterized protein LOC126252793 [Schistocerca nitens]
MAVLVCTCCQGNKENICKHVDWDSIVLPSEKYREAVDYDSICRLYYFIVTNEEPLEEWLELLYSYQNAMASNSSECLELMDIGLLCESEEEMPNTLVIKAVLYERNNDLIEEIQASLSDFSNKSPKEVRKWLEAMCEKLRKFKTPWRAPSNQPQD